MVQLVQLVATTEQVAQSPVHPPGTSLPTSKRDTVGIPFNNMVTGVVHVLIADPFTIDLIRTSST